MSYIANIKMGRYSYFYKDEELLFTVYIKPVFLYFVRDCILYNDAGNEIFSFRENNFAFGFRTKILKQSLHHFISIKRKNLNSYYLNFNDREIY